MPREPLPGFQIGELSRRTEVSPQLLRAWERRYRLLQPVRTTGGYRLYAEPDEHRVRRMQAYLARGLSAAEAARVVLRADAVSPPPEDRGLAGAGATQALATEAGARLLAGNPVTEARQAQHRTGLSLHGQLRHHS